MQGGREGQVGAPRQVQDVEWVRQHARVEALLRHPRLLLLEGLRGGQRRLGRGRQREVKEGACSLVGAQVSGVNLVQVQV